METWERKRKGGEWRKIYSSIKIIFKKGLQGKETTTTKKKKPKLGRLRLGLHVGRWGME